jgi:hypothetical protein
MRAAGIGYVIAVLDAAHRMRIGKSPPRVRGD